VAGGGGCACRRGFDAEVSCENETFVPVVGPHVKVAIGLGIVNKFDLVVDRKDGDRPLCR
jgi:hypothetical protein